MKIASPTDLISQISGQRWAEFMGGQTLPSDNGLGPSYVEPANPETLDMDLDGNPMFNNHSETGGKLCNATLQGRVQTLGDFIDTDAVGSSHQRSSWVACADGPDLVSTCAIHHRGQ